MQTFRTRKHHIKYPWVGLQRNSRIPLSLETVGHNIYDPKGVTAPSLSLLILLKGLSPEHTHRATSQEAPLNTQVPLQIQPHTDAQAAWFIIKSWDNHTQFLNLDLRNCYIHLVNTVQMFQQQSRLTSAQMTQVQCLMDQQVRSAQNHAAPASDIVTDPRSLHVGGKVLLTLGDDTSSTRTQDSLLW